MSHTISPIELSDTHAAIADVVFDALILIQSKRPNWIKERYRGVALAKGKVVQAVLSTIDKQTGQNYLAQGVAHFLQLILEPAVLHTEFYRRLMESILAKAPPTPNHQAYQDLQHRVAQSSGKTLRSLPSPDAESEYIAILLVDAENIDLPKDVENWVVSLLENSASLKMAFGDWKKLGNRDKDLHSRGYQLIHVPTGKNHADTKMTVIGSSLLVHFPNIKEAVVCSNDNDLTGLRNTLSLQGLDVGWLQRQENEFKFVSCRAKKEYSFQLTDLPKIPTLKVGIDYLKQWLAEQEGTEKDINSLSMAFRQKFGLPVNKFLQHHQHGKSFKAFLQKNTDFLMSFEAKSSQIFVSLAKASTDLEDNVSESSPVEPKKFTLNSLKWVLRGTARRLIAESDQEFVPVVTVASTFQKQHEKPIKIVFKELGINQSLPTFLQTCKDLKVEMRENQWVVVPE